MNEKLSENQINWIFSKVQAFTNKWEAHGLSTDSDWEQLIAEATDLERKSRRNPLAVQMIMGSLTYFDKKYSKGVTVQ